MPHPEYDRPIIVGSGGPEMDFSMPSSEEPDDAPLVRSLEETDLSDVVRIDRHITGRDRGSYITQKMSEVLKQSGIRISLVSENRESQITGFIMARLDYGEFGRTSSTAVIDTIGVDPAYRGAHVGQSLIKQLLANLKYLQVGEVQTEVAWDDFELSGFLAHSGFCPAQQLVLSCPL